MPVASKKGGKRRPARERADAGSVRRMLQSDGPKSPRPSSIEDLYGGGVTGNLLRGEYGRGDVYAWLQKRHSKGGNFLDDAGFFCIHGHRWRVPYGVRMALDAPLRPEQLRVKYPYLVTWVSPKTGKRLKKRFMSLAHAIAFITEKAQYVDSNASIISAHAVDIPSKLRGKLPRTKIVNGRRHRMYWCPCCLTERRFRRTGREFFAMRKEWNEVKSRWEYLDRKLAELECPICGITNQDPIWRRSNQPWEVRKIKRGVRRVKRRRRRG